MKFIITILLITLSFNSYSQIDSIKSKFSISTITNFFKKKTKNTLQNNLSDTSSSITSKKTSQDSTISDTSLNKKIVQIKKDSLLKTTYKQPEIDSAILQNELTKRIQSSNDSSSKAINIFIMNSNNIDVNVSSGGIVTVSKIPPGFNQQMFNNMLSNNEQKKKGFLSDMDSSKLASLITLILASIPIIINATK